MIGAIVHAVQVINSFTDDAPVLGITQIAQNVGMAPSSIHHIVDTLCVEGILQRLPNNKYTLGFKMVEWGTLSLQAHPVTRISGAPMKKLMEQFNETVHLAAYDPQDRSMVYLQKFECNRSLRISTRVGARQPSHCTSLGKAYLAFAPQSLALSVAQHLCSQTSHSIVHPEQFITDLQAIRLRGYAIDNEEGEDGVFCVGAPILTANGKPLAAVSLAGPAKRINTPHTLPQIITGVLRCAHVISQYLIV